MPHGKLRTFDSSFLGPLSITVRRRPESKNWPPVVIFGEMLGRQQRSWHDGNIIATRQVTPRGHNIYIAVARRNLEKSDTFAISHLVASITVDIRFN